METVEVITVICGICGVAIPLFIYYWNKNTKIVSIIHSVREEITSNWDRLRNLEKYYNTNRDKIDKYETSIQTGNYDSLRNKIGILGERISQKISEYYGLIGYIKEGCFDSSRKKEVSDDCKSKISHVINLGDEIKEDLKDKESKVGPIKLILHYSSNIWCSQIEKLYQKCKNKKDR